MEPVTYVTEVSETQGLSLLEAQADLRMEPDKDLSDSARPRVLQDKDLKVNVMLESDEKSPFIVETENGAVSTVDSTATIDELLEQLAAKPNWKFCVMMMTLLSVWLGQPAITYATVFAGIDPTASDNWTCLTTKCEELATNFKYNASTGTLFPCLTTTDNTTGQEILALNSSDYKWNLERSSFAADFDIVCGFGSRKTRKTLISSIFFAGALCGLTIGGYLFDNFGRKRSALVASFLAVGITFLGTFCHDYCFLLVIRFSQGFSMFIVATGMYVLAQELLPARYRNYMNGWSMCLWAFGYPIAAGLGYFIKNWNYMFLAGSIILLLTYLPIIFAIESPRYYLINNNTEAAKESLVTLARRNGVELNLKGTVLGSEGESKERKQSLLQQLKEFYHYPILLMETAMQMFFWFVVAMSYYGFNFGWGSIIPDRYAGYLLAMVGELIAYVAAVPLISYIGRRRAMMLLFTLAAVIYLVAIPEVPLTSDPDGWTLESVAALLGIIFVSSAFSVAYLYTGELAPTSHRGLVYGMSSSCARVGAFLGPFIFNNMFDIMPKWEPLCLLALLALLSALGSFGLVETGNRAIASTAEDVTVRRRKYYKCKL